MAKRKPKRRPRSTSLSPLRPKPKRLCSAEPSQSSFRKLSETATRQSLFDEFQPFDYDDNGPLDALRYVNLESDLAGRFRDKRIEVNTWAVPQFVWILSNNENAKMEDRWNIRSADDAVPSEYKKKWMEVEDKTKADEINLILSMLRKGSRTMAAQLDSSTWSWTWRPLNKEERTLSQSGQGDGKKGGKAKEVAKNKKNSSDEDTQGLAAEMSGTEDELGDEDFHEPSELCIESRSEEDEFAQCHNFTLESEELKKCLATLLRGKGAKNQTSTSRWCHSTSSASAACKVFKTNRWHLTDVNIIFDPLVRDEDTYQVETSALLWPRDGLAKNMISVKALSVDGLLSTMGNRQMKMDNLKKLDEALKAIDGKITPELTSENTIDNVLGRLVLKGTLILPAAVLAPFHRFTFSLLHAMVNLEKNEKVPKATFQNIFETLFSCITACINEEKRIDCRSTMDGIALDKLDLAVFLKNRVKKLCVSPKSDLFIFERTQQIFSKRAVAVVTVKGKQGHSVLHSEDEDESEGSNTTSLGVTEEDSEVELPLVEKITKRKHNRMKRLKPVTKNYVRSFLPQLIGEMMCCNETTSVLRVKKKEPGYSFGVAVVGFDVYFVALVTSNQSEDVKMTFTRSDLYTNVFITRPFNMCVKSDRRILLKVLAAACYVEDPIAFAYRNENDIVGLDFSHLKIR